MHLYLNARRHECHDAEAHGRAGGHPDEGRSELVWCGAAVFTCVAASQSVSSHFIITHAVINLCMFRFQHPVDLTDVPTSFVFIQLYYELVDNRSS